MSFFDSLDNLRRTWQAGVVDERTQIQVTALRDSNPTDPVITMKIMGDDELESMSRAGWVFVTTVTTSEHTFANEYLICVPRSQLSRLLGRDM